MYKIQFVELKDQKHQAVVFDHIVVHSFRLKKKLKT